MFRPARCSLSMLSLLPYRCLRRPLLLSFVFLPIQAVSEPAEAPHAGIDILTVTAPRVANLQPASTYAAPVTVLRYDPQVDLQSRGLPEGQADVTVRGGLFENTGFDLGAATLIDPQTGHYVAEVPIDPWMLSAPTVLTGIDSAVAGFNASVATVRYSLNSVRSGGDLLMGAGTDDLSFVNLRSGYAHERNGGGVLGAAASYARSESDGSRPHGDHDFERFTAQLQHRNESSESNLVYGYQDKFFGWPGAYTGFASLAETDHTQTHLLFANHRRDLGGDGWWELAGYFRDLDNDYDFDRSTDEHDGPGAFEHRTRSYALAAEALVPGDGLDWRLSAQLSGDELVRSTDLVAGAFHHRRYANVSVVPEKSWRLGNGGVFTLRGGITGTYSNRDEDVLLPLAGMYLSLPSGAAVNRFAVEFAATSQVPGYTALNSNPTGLFGGNADLGRERADTLSVTAEREAASWYGRITAFYRQDDDLVDWTYRSGAPFARQANAVDMDVSGLELELARRWDRLELIGGYSYLHKDEDYGSAQVDGSFYALNYADHRLTLALLYQPVEWLDVRLDNELVRQHDNPLRNSDDDAYLASLAIGWISPVPGLRADVTVDNLTDSDFEQLPGTPPPRRQASVNLRYSW